MIDFEDYLKMIIDLASEKGASYAEARFQEDAFESTLLKNGIPEVTSFDTKRGISIRVIVDGALGFGATNRMNKNDIRNLVAKVVSSAKEASRMRESKIRFEEGATGKERFEIKPRIKFESVSTESRIELLREADTAAIEAARSIGINLPGRYISLDTAITTKIIITSDGADVRSSIPRVSIDSILTAFDPQKGYAQRTISLGESSGWEAVERWDLPVRLRNESTSLGQTLLNAESFESGRYDVVLGPEVVGIVSHESAGHPAEADRILGRESAQAGETYLTKESVGIKVGSEVINVVDDPTIPHSFGYYLYDDEGVRARRRYLIKNGRIHEFLHNRETAHEFGTESNASSRSVSYDREPIVRMSNTFVEPGEYSFEELIEGISNGIYIKNFMEWNIDDRRYNQKYVGLEAYKIENGTLAKRIRNPVIEITTPSLWSAVDAVGKDLEFSAATCGKGDPMQGIPVWTGGPHLRLRGIFVGGSA
ncbi:MAG: TldD/PmbA family protein [Methanomassiliicoccales archaeon]|jgi:TldD protein|nr:TldD/PmbA family protein [Methanomassiliicoccales archaeon]